MLPLPRVTTVTNVTAYPVINSQTGESLSNSSPPMARKLAVFSGYEMSPNDFKTFIYSLQPELEHEPSDLQLQKCVLGYDSCRRRLPRGEMGSAPKLRREWPMTSFSRSDSHLSSASSLQIQGSHRNS